MTTCDRSDHDHKSLTAARVCAALEEVERDARGASKGEPEFEDGAEWAVRRVRDALEDAEKAEAR